MKITSNILSIPPYLSVAWKDIFSLHTKTDSFGLPTILVVTLRNQSQMEIPHLENSTLEEIFDAFSRYSEQEKPIEKKDGPFHFALPLKKEGEPFHAPMAHNPEQANLPNLPPEMLEKVTQIAKIFGLENTSLLPTPEPHCNCIHCQIIRSLHGGAPLSPLSMEEEVSPKDLTFRHWDIKQVDTKLYTVTNPLDAAEQYSVFLGEPIGCTCGEKKCEHIHAVLST